MQFQVQRGPLFWSRLVSHRLWSPVLAHCLLRREIHSQALLQCRCGRDAHSFRRACGKPAAQTSFQPRFQGSLVKSLSNSLSMPPCQLCSHSVMYLHEIHLVSCSLHVVTLQPVKRFRSTCSHVFLWLFAGGIRRDGVCRRDRGWGYNPSFVAALFSSSRARDCSPAVVRVRQRAPTHSRIPLTMRSITEARIS